MGFRSGVLALILCAALASAAERPLEQFHRAEIEPTKTSIYLGTVTMTMPAFTRANGAYETLYTAKVFPFFFYNEHGRLTIDVSDAMLRALERGETVEFKGRAVSSEGEPRHVEGKATPADPASGKLKVRVFVSKRIELIFNTTYRFPGVR